MIEEQAAKYIADGGSVAQVEEVTGLEFKTVSPDLVAVDEMNERTHDTLDTKELEDSIAEVGIVEPPVCRVIDSDADVPYGVVQGQRRVTAAKALELDEIPILIGEFEDLEALTRSITENISAARQDVSSNSRAAAIWRWWVLYQEEVLGEQVQKNSRPEPSLVGEEFGVPASTARKWLEPLHPKYSGTELDPRINFINDDIPEGERTIKNPDISPRILAGVRRMGFEKEEAVDVVREVQKKALTVDELNKVLSMKKNPNLDIDVHEAIEAQVQARKEARKATERFMLKRFYVSGSMAKGLRAAESDLGKPREDIVKIAVGRYLESEGYT
jgi:ParB/RepB/Spo0J family partition protein